MKKLLAFLQTLFGAEEALAPETASRSEPASAPGRVNLEEDDLAVAKWIWRNLVPKQGQSDTLQGELLRAVERLRWEAQNNGNINWDDGFLRFLDFLEAHLTAEPAFTPERKRAIAEDIERLRAFEGIDEDGDEAAFQASLPYVEDDLYDRLSGAVVAYARLHPVLIPRAHDPEQFR